jgi:hypothetical protein
MINITETVCEGVDRIQMTQDRMQWQAVFNIVIILSVP